MVFYGVDKAFESNKSFGKVGCVHSQQPTSEGDLHRAGHHQILVRTLWFQLPNFPSKLGPSEGPCLHQHHDLAIWNPELQS